MDNSLPLVSIVFTSYNHKEYLKQALDSLINQTYQNIEIIIVDDCSTDGSQEILKQYEKYKHIVLKLNNQNSGSYVKASNYGASFAKGEYLIFAQCDDYAVTEQIKILSDILNQYPTVGVVYSKSILVNEQGKVLSDDFVIREKKFKEVVAKKSLIPGYKFRELLSVSCVIPNLSAAMIRRELYDKVNGLSQEYYMASDWRFWLELSELTNFYYLSQPLNNFRQHATTIRSKTKIDNHLKEIFNVFQSHIEKYKLKGKDKNQFYIGFGNIWFTYFLETPIVVFSSIFSILFYTISKNKFIIFYLTIGVLNKLKSIINNKI
jgi:glycosyltransferase involved in cell wall biosynthesis